jgi:hypothetical protein
MPESNRIIDDRRGGQYAAATTGHSSASPQLGVFAEHQLMEGSTSSTPTAFISTRPTCRADIFWVRENSPNCILVEDRKYWRSA